MEIEIALDLIDFGVSQSYLELQACASEELNKRQPIG